MKLCKLWEEHSRTLVLQYEQEDNQIYNFYIYSDGFPGTRFRNYTSLYPLKVESFSELMKIVPINVLRDIELVDEDKSWEY